MLAMVSWIDAIIDSMKVSFRRFDMELDRATHQDDEIAAILAITSLKSFLESMGGGMIDSSLIVLQRHLPQLATANVLIAPSLTSYQLQQSFVNQVRQELDQTLAQARLQATPGVPLAVQIEALTSPMARRSMLGAADATAGRIVNLNLLSSGSGIFTRKQAVPILDSETTDLCRNRMAFQVVLWDGLFTDPETGAAWETPPFIGNGLPRREIFHYCRTGMRPMV